MSVSSDKGQVGYKRPPKATQWKKGQSGNPKRRYARKANNPAETLESLLMAPVSIPENGKYRRVSTLEAIITMLWHKEMSGDQRSLRARLRFREFAYLNTEKTLETTFSESDYTRALAAEAFVKGSENG